MSGCLDEQDIQAVLSAIAATRVQVKRTHVALDRVEATIVAVKASALGDSQDGRSESCVQHRAVRAD